jgi:hypothetical protein
VPLSIRDASLVEAARLWAPYGIIVDSKESAAGEASIMRLAVVFDGERDIEGEDGLGSIRFDQDGVPSSEITVYYRAVVRLAMSTAAFGTAAPHWPAKLRDQVVARALGRALAHEIGHYLLRSPHHERTGLMRARYQASALADPDRKAFRLTDVDLARLKIALNAPQRVPALAASVATATE